jgi:hypothetical protein
LILFLVLLVALLVMKQRLERNIEIGESNLDNRVPTPLRPVKNRTSNPHLLSFGAFPVRAGYFSAIVHFLVVADEWLTRLAPWMLKSALALLLLRCVLYEVTGPSLFTSLFQCLTIASILNIWFAPYWLKQLPEINRMS